MPGTRQFQTSYALRRGPGGVFGAATVDDLAGMYVRGSWSGGTGGVVLKGILVRKPLTGESAKGFETAESWLRARCGEGLQVFIANPAASQMVGGVTAGDRALLATSDPAIIAAVTQPNWIGTSIDPMESVACPEAKLTPPSDSGAVRAAAIAGGVVLGLWAIGLGAHFLTKKK